MSMFFIESLGFGRGLGALDLSKDKIEDNFKILNPDLLNEDQKEAIVNSFTPLLNRERYALDVELKREDRMNFESVIFKTFNIDGYLEPIKKSLLQLFKIRQAVNN